MTITLTSKEFDEAVSLWLEDQGFSPDSYNITTRVIAGRSDGPLGTRLEVTLDAKPRTGIHPSLAQIPLGRLASIMDIPEVPTIRTPPGTFTQRASQGHVDE